MNTVMKRFALTGKVAMVTGASRGLGKAIAIGLADAGADVVVTSRSLEACQEVAREIDARGRRALAGRMDHAVMGVLRPSGGSSSAAGAGRAAGREKKGLAP